MMMSSQKQLARSALVSGDHEISTIMHSGTVMNSPSEIDDMKFEEDESMYEDDDLGSDESDGKDKVVKYSTKPYTTF
jgi:hypothetical protein